MINDKVDKIIEEIYKEILLPSILEMEARNKKNLYFYNLKSELFEKNYLIAEFRYLEDYNSFYDTLYFLYEYLNRFIYNESKEEYIPKEIMEKNILKAKKIINKYYENNYLYKKENIFRYINFN